MERLNKHLARIVPTVVLVVGVIVAFLMFIQNNAVRIEGQNEEYLSELTVQRAASIDTLISENLTFIDSTAYLFGQSLASSSVDVDVLQDYEENAAFDMLRFVNARGDNYTSEGMKANLADRDYFKAGMRGETGVAFVPVSRVTGQRQIGFYAPVRHGEEIVGVMVGFYGEDYVSKLLDYELFGYGGEGWLCLRDGTVVGTTLADEPDNYLVHLAESGACTTEELAMVKEAFASGRDISFTSREDGEDATARAAALVNAEWMLVRDFPPSASSQIIDNANREGIRLIMELVVLFALYVLVIALGVFLEQRRTREAMRNANDISSGMATLFERFIAVDFETGEFAYIGGRPGDLGLPERGPYSQYREALLERVPEQAARVEAGRALDLENLRAELANADVFSLRVHAPKDDVLWLTYSFVVIEREEGGDPRRVLLVCQDATELYEREQAEQERLRRALDVAESASAAKTEFLFNMSHDLRTPMNAIIGYAELAQREGVTADDMREYMRKIDSSGEHLLSLINDILEMGRIESGKMALSPERADIVRIVEDARDMFTAQMAEAGIAFTVDVSGVHDRWVLCDTSRLDRVVLNLMSNALKFTDAGGEVRVRLSQEGAAGPDGSASYVLSVADTGIGMSDEFVSRLFSPFERERTSTVSKTQGTGLGLSITKKIIDLMGGSIDVRTAQGEGSEFTVRVSLPVAEAGEDASADAPAAAAAPDFKGARVLLVEDNEINREIAAMILGQAGFELETAVNGKEAYEAVAQSAPGHFDAVLMDIQMPVMDGYEATRAIRALDDEVRSSIPIVAMTANAFAEDVQAALDAGMDGHIAKPIDVHKMLATLADALSARA